MIRNLKVMIATLLVGSVVAIPSSASAITECDAVVVDKTSDRVLDVNYIEQAPETQQLLDLGVALRVRALEYAPSDDLGVYVENQMRACSSWTLPNASTEPVGNLLVVVFSFQPRAAYIYYGPSYITDLDPHWSEIIVNDMRPNLQAGNYDDAFLDTEQSLYQALMGEYGYHNGEDIPNTDSETTGSSSDVSDETLKVIGGISVGLIILGALIFGGLFYYKRRQTLKRLHEAAERDAGDASVEVSQLEDEDEFTRRYQETLPGLDDIFTRDLRPLFEAAVEDSRVAVNYPNMPDGFSLETHNLTVEQLQQISTHARERLVVAQKASASIKALNDECLEIQDSIVNAPKRLKSLNTELARLDALQANLKEQGYRHDDSASLEKVRQLVNTATALINAKQAAQALDELAAAGAQLQECANRLERIESIHQTLTARHGELKTRFARVSDQSNAAGADLTAMKRRFNPDCLAGIDERLTDARNSLEYARTSLADAEKANTMEAQQWDSAENLLDEAEGACSSVATAAAFVAERKSMLENLASTLPGTVTELQSSVSQSTALVSGLRGDQSTAVGQLRRLFHQVASLVKDVKASKPQYFTIESSAASLGQSLKQIVDAAQAIHDDIVEQERLAALAAAEAERRRLQEEQDRQDAAERQRAMHVSSNPSHGSSPRSHGGGGGVGW